MLLKALKQAEAAVRLATLASLASLTTYYSTPTHDWWVRGLHVNTNCTDSGFKWQHQNKAAPGEFVFVFVQCEEGEMPCPSLYTPIAVNHIAAHLLLPRTLADMQRSLLTHNLHKQYSFVLSSWVGNTDGVVALIFPLCPLYDEWAEVFLGLHSYTPFTVCNWLKKTGKLQLITQNATGNIWRCNFTNSSRGSNTWVKQT